MMARDVWMGKGWVVDLAKGGLLMCEIGISREWRPIMIIGVFGLWR